MYSCIDKWFIQRCGWCSFLLGGVTTCSAGFVVTRNQWISPTQVGVLEIYNGCNFVGICTPVSKKLHSVLQELPLRVQHNLCLLQSQEDNPKLPVTFLWALSWMRISSTKQTTLSMSVSSVVCPRPSSGAVVLVTSTSLSSSASHSSVGLLAHIHWDRRGGRQDTIALCNLF